MDAALMKKFLQTTGVRPAHIYHADTIPSALQTLSRLAYEVPPRILITGSLYLAGPVLAANGAPPG